MTDGGTSANESLRKHAGYQCLGWQWLQTSMLGPPTCERPCAGLHTAQPSCTTCPARILPPERRMLCPSIPQVCLQTVFVIKHQSTLWPITDLVITKNNDVQMIYYGKICNNNVIIPGLLMLCFIITSLLHINIITSLSRCP